ncbi:MAG: hypothetical protein Q9216_002858 [Gyalolechia sp. 2 TL-2023]
MTFVVFLRRTLVVGTCFFCLRPVVCSPLDSRSTNSHFEFADTDIATRALDDVLPGSTTTGKYGPDAIPIGNYTLLGCSSSGTGSKADYLTTFLPTMLDRLRHTMADVELGENSFHGYRAFFKRANERIIKSVFWNIQQATPVTLTTSRGERVETPKIVCLGEGEEDSHVTGVGNLYDYYCAEGSGRQAPTAHFHDSELIVLCPNFFYLAPWPAMQACPRLINGDLKPDGSQLMQSQFAMMVRVLAGLYVPLSRLNPPSTSSDLPLNLKAAVALPQGAAQRSRDSYAYYAAGQSKQSNVREHHKVPIIKVWHRLPSEYIADYNRSVGLASLVIHYCHALSGNPQKQIPDHSAILNEVKISKVPSAGANRGGTDIATAGKQARQQAVSLP